MKKGKRNYLDLIPELNENLGFEKDEEGRLVILVHNRGLFNKIAQRLFKKPETTKVHLDDRGSYIIPLVDGKRTVSELALLQKEKFGEAVEPLYPRFVKYMQIMESYGFVKTK